jgi:hypothetical protein
MLYIASNKNIFVNCTWNKGIVAYCKTYLQSYIFGRTEKITKKSISEFAIPVAAAGRFRSTDLFRSQFYLNWSFSLSRGRSHSLLPRDLYSGSFVSVGPEDITDGAWSVVIVVPLLFYVSFLHFSSRPNMNLYFILVNKTNTSSILHTHSVVINVWGLQMENLSYIETKSSYNLGLKLIILIYRDCLDVLK